ncbi:prolyl oligopeptidase family serine peptidase [Streptomyces sp. P38-E01]|uniref:Prolyl oligopeptidase family serine peptidase n=1 Tax=Streptomyces tardus TaxID=2780544 RepID=A0A949N6M1_9ACTN|nr:prolyl oligopeptidase family serine peptidase [Streptomyces tardus]MBU7599212.1 prolyl oligopeptidase family serine peptidase [Streptomyces tardus]
MSTEPESFPRQHARTQRFTLGAPRSFTVAPDGERVVFLRSAAPSRPAGALWVHDLAADAGDAERLAADPAELLGGADEQLSAEERARRERSREGGAGIVGYATDAAVELAAFALSGRLFVTGLADGTTRELPVPAPVVDPRPSPDGRWIAYVADRTLRVARADGGADTAVAVPENGEVSLGLAEFIAAEEMQRHRGHWWSPDSDRLLVARVDNSPVRRWWISDPANPQSPPSEIAYPAAGTPNADVGLELRSIDGSSRTEIRWDRETHPYLVAAHWSAGGPPLLLVQRRDQREQRYLTVDVESGETTTLHIERDDTWLEIIAGGAAWSPDGQLVRVSDASGARALVVGERTLTGPELHLRAVLDVGPDDVLVSAAPGRAATTGAGAVGDVAVHRIPYAAGAAAERICGPAPLVASAVRGGDTTVLVTASLDRFGARAEILRAGTTREIGSYAATPVLTPAPRLLRAGETDGVGIPTAVLLPTGYSSDDGPLPVLMDPYGGPHGQRVVAARNAYLTSQWFADQGFAVIVADGRGAPGDCPSWEKAIAGNLAALNIEDQITALHAVAAEVPLDLQKVAIRGWSYGGYLSALAVLRRPDVFHAGVVGAPVTDQRLYDTHYTERYLGDPNTSPHTYAENSVVTDEGLRNAADEHRPMLIVHGLADDNVVVAHSLRLSSALLAAGRPHEVLPLSGVTHMTPQEQVAENLLLLQVDFLRRSLGLTAAL